MFFLLHKVVDIWKKKKTLKWLSLCFVVTFNVCNLAHFLMKHSCAGFFWNIEQWSSQPFLSSWYFTQKYWSILWISQSVEQKYINLTNKQILWGICKAIRDWAGLGTGVCWVFPWHDLSQHCPFWPETALHLVGEHSFTWWACRTAIASST